MNVDSMEFEKKFVDPPAIDLDPSNILVAAWHMF
jgi:hypothetical protein